MGPARSGQPLHRVAKWRFSEGLIGKRQSKALTQSSSNEEAAVGEIYHGAGL